MTANIPLVDLAAAHTEVADEIATGFADVLARTSFVQGRQVGEFEAAFAEFTGVGTCVGVANGTDALEIALRAVGIGRGDEVIVPANTFVATAEAVVRAGAEPVFVDATEDALIDPAAVRAAVGPRTAAVMPVHLYGQAPDMGAIESIARAHGIAVIEDAAQSQGAEQGGRRLGSFGVAAGTSFYPGKNLGAYGDGGAVLTSDPDVAHRARLIANHGSLVRYQHEVFGFNSRLDTLQAVVLLAKLARLDGANDRRGAAAARYDDLLRDVEQVVRPRAVPGNRHVWHLYVVRVPERDRVLESLHQQGVGAGIHYPVPLHLMPPFAGGRDRRGEFPVAEALADSILSLPMYPQITADQQTRTAAALRSALAG